MTPTQVGVIPAQAGNQNNLDSRLPVCVYTQADAQADAGMTGDCMSLSEATVVLNRGGLAVIPTDTLYGIVARALDKKAVRRLYRIRRHTPQKPFIILISNRKDLAAFGIRPSAAVSRFLQRAWPGAVSVILPCRGKKFAYLHRETNTLAFRLPRSRWLLSLVHATGPLVAPSANPEGKKPAETMAQARRYFGTEVDAYASGGRLAGKPSTLVSLTGKKPRLVRKGGVSVQL